MQSGQPGSDLPAPICWHDVIDNERIEMMHLRSFLESLRAGFRGDNLVTGSLQCQPRYVKHGLSIVNDQNV